MCSTLHWLVWPIGQCILSSKHVGKILFDRGIWKSVNFDVPIISIHSMSNELVDWVLIDLMLKEIQSVTTLKSEVLLSAQHLKFYGFEMNPTEYLMNICSTKESKLIWGYRHFLLGLAELIGRRERQMVTLIPSNRFYSELRPSMRILYIDAQKPVFKEAPWPMGNRTEPTSWMSAINLVLLDERKVEMGDQMLQTLDSLSLAAPIVRIISQDLTGRSHNAQQVGIFIDDRDNFGSALQKTLKQFEFN